MDANSAAVIHLLVAAAWFVFGGSVLLNLLPRWLGTHKWSERIPREAGCPACGAVTSQVRHGFRRNPVGWDGEPCDCGGWECQVCGRVLDRRGECNRR